MEKNTIYKIKVTNSDRDWNDEILLLRESVFSTLDLIDEFNVKRIL